MENTDPQSTRTSILKPPRERAPLQQMQIYEQDDDTTSVRLRRVSFCYKNHIKEFQDNAATHQFTSEYEEHVQVSDSSNQMNSSESHSQTHFEKSFMSVDNTASITDEEDTSSGPINLIISRQQNSPMNLTKSLDCSMNMSQSSKTSKPVDCNSSMMSHVYGKNQKEDFTEACMNLVRSISENSSADLTALLIHTKGKNKSINNSTQLDVSDVFNNTSKAHDISENMQTFHSEGKFMDDIFDKENIADDKVSSIGKSHTTQGMLKSILGHTFTSETNSSHFHVNVDEDMDTTSFIVAQDPLKQDNTSVQDMSCSELMNNTNDDTLRLCNDMSISIQVDNKTITEEQEISVVSDISRNNIETDPLSISLLMPQVAPPKRNNNVTENSVINGTVNVDVLSMCQAGVSLLRSPDLSEDMEMTSLFSVSGQTMLKDVSIGEELTNLSEVPDDEDKENVPVKCFGEEFNEDSEVSMTEDEEDLTQSQNNSISEKNMNLINDSGMMVHEEFVSEGKEENGTEDVSKVETQVDEKVLVEERVTECDVVEDVNPTDVAGVEQHEGLNVNETSKTNNTKVSQTCDVIKKCVEGDNKEDENASISADIDQENMDVSVTVEKEISVSVDEKDENIKASVTVDTGSSTTVNKDVKDIEEENMDVSVPVEKEISVHVDEEDENIKASVTVDTGSLVTVNKEDVNTSVAESIDQEKNEESVTVDTDVSRVCDNIPEDADAKVTGDDKQENTQMIVVADKDQDILEDSVEAGVDIQENSQGDVHQMSKSPEIAKSDHVQLEKMNDSTESGLKRKLTETGAQMFIKNLTEIVAADSVFDGTSDISLSDDFTFTGDKISSTKQHNFNNKKLKVENDDVIIDELKVYSVNNEDFQIIDLTSDEKWILAFVLFQYTVNIELNLKKCSVIDNQFYSRVVKHNISKHLNIEYQYPVDTTVMDLGWKYTTIDNTFGVFENVTSVDQLPQIVKSLHKKLQSIEMCLRQLRLILKYYPNSTITDNILTFYLWSHPLRYAYDVSVNITNLLNIKRQDLTLKYKFGAGSLNIKDVTEIFYHTIKNGEYLIKFIQELTNYVVNLEKNHGNIVTNRNYIPLLSFNKNDYKKFIVFKKLN